MYSAGIVYETLSRLLSETAKTFVLSFWAKAYGRFLIQQDYQLNISAERHYGFVLFIWLIAFYI